MQLLYAFFVILFASIGIWMLFDSFLIGLLLISMAALCGLASYKRARSKGTPLISIAFTFGAALFFWIGIFVFVHNQNIGLILHAASVVCLIVAGVIEKLLPKECEKNSTELLTATKTNIKRKKGRKRYSTKGYCLSGLPFGECDCNITVYDDVVVFSSGKSISNLNTSKITTAAVRTKTELTSASTGSAILGTALFGIVGTVIASRPKNKSQYILVINYVSGEPKTIAIAFDDYQKYEAENIAFFLNKKATSDVTEL